MSQVEKICNAGHRGPVHVRTRAKGQLRHLVDEALADLIEKRKNTGPVRM